MCIVQIHIDCAGLEMAKQLVMAIEPGDSGIR